MIGMGTKTYSECVSVSDTEVSHLLNTVLHNFKKSLYDQILKIEYVTYVGRIEFPTRTHEDIYTDGGHKSR